MLVLYFLSSDISEEAKDRGTMDMHTKAFGGPIGTRKTGRDNEKDTLYGPALLRMNKEGEKSTVVMITLKMIRLQIGK